MVEVFVALGTNLGDRLENLRQALQEIDRLMDILDMSPVYETAPKYVLDQPPFLNMVVRGETALEARRLLADLKSAEAALGRDEEEVRYGPRVIDLDILFYGESIINLPDLRIPHDKIAERAFVLRPLADIAAAKRHPETGRSIGEMLARLEGDGEAAVYLLDV